MRDGIETELKIPFSLKYSWLQQNIRQCWLHQIFLAQDLALEFCRSQNKDTCILSKTHINQEQIHQVRNNWLGHIFFSSGD